MTLRPFCCPLRRSRHARRSWVPRFPRILTAGLPVLMRPSYVLGGQNMIVAYTKADVIEYMGACSVDFMAVSSYGNQTTTTGAVKINKDLNQDIEGRDIILVEDILDSGVTLHYLKDYLSVRRPASITIATLLDKPARRKAPIHAAYAGFEVPDAFVVGYGLDYAEKYRNLPYIGVLKPEVYST